MSWLRLSTLSIGSLTTTILLGVIAGYMLAQRKKQADAWYLAGYIFALFILLLSYTIRYSVYSPAALATGQMSNLVVFGVVSLIQFAYHFGGNEHPRESRVVLILSLAASFFVWASLFLPGSRPAVYDFKAEYFTYVYGPRISILTLIGYVWACIVFIRKVGRLSGRTAASARSFALLTVATIPIPLQYVLFQLGVVSRAAYSFVFNTGSLLICLFIFIVYMNNAPRPTSLLTRLVGIPLAIILVAFGVAASVIMPVVNETLSDRYRSEVAQAKNAIRSRDLAIVPENLAFLLPFPVGSDPLAYIGSGAAEQDATLLVSSQAVEGLLPAERGFAPQFAYRDLLDTGSYFFFYTFWHEGVSFRVGFPYSDYRLAVHRFASKIALIVLAVSIIVVFGFPLAFRRGLLRPLAILLSAVQRVSAGDYRTEVAVTSEDEVGQLARGYNAMLASLRNAEGSFKALAENANDAILILSREGRILYVNPRAAEVSGYSAAALRGKDFLEIVGLEEQGDLVRLFEARMTGRGTQRPLESRIVHRDGHAVPVEITGANTVWQDEVGNVVVIRDVSERIEAEELLRSQQEKLRQADKLASLGALVAGVVHEVNNPNQVVSLDARLLSEGLPGLFAIAESGEEADESVRVAGMPYREFKDAVRTAVSEIESSAARIDHIVGELKRFARGGPAAKKEPTDVNSVVRAVVDISRNLIGKATRNFSLSLDGTLPLVQADRTGLEQVVLNLLLNACQSLPDPRRGVRISTYFDEEAAAVCIEVRDEGIGISEENLPRITDPFFTTRGEKGGTGLGLTVSDRIVRAHGGSLSVQSQFGGGTTVSVRLPAAGTPEAPPHVAP
jgi:PAS domain S-box-containing protein